MPQLQLPMFPDGLTPITEDLAFQREDGKVVYFHGLMPVFQHDEKDLKSFRMFTSQLIANGTVRQRDIVQAFGVPLATVKRYMKVHREQGAAGFFRVAAAAFGQRAHGGSQAASAGVVGRGQERARGEPRRWRGGRHAAQSDSAPGGCTRLKKSADCRRGPRQQ